MRKLGRGSLAALLVVSGAVVAHADDDKKNETITVYKPYSKLDDIFSDKGGVFLPADELKKLIDQLNGIKDHPAPRNDEAPPAPFVHVGARYRGAADETVARFEGTFDFEILERSKWVEIPLGLGADVALEEAKTSDGKRAIVRATATGYSILAQGAGPLSVTVKFTVPLKKERPGERSFELKLARAALSTFEVDIPERDLRVDVTPSLGATPVSDATKTHVTAYLASGDAPVTVTWHPRPKDVESNQKPVVHSQVGVGLRLDEGVAKAFVQAHYTMPQVPADTFRLSVPKGWKIFDVAANGLRDDPIAETAGSQTLTVLLHERVKDAVVTFRLERARDEQGRFEFPAVRTLDVDRETGVLAASSSSFLKLDAGTVTGLSQVDPGEIPAAITQELHQEEGDRAPLGWSFLKNEYRLELATTKVEPEVEGRVFALATVKDDEISYFATIFYDIKKRGIFGVKIKLPAGFTNVDCGDETTVKSAVTRDATAADKWAGQILDVDFARQAKPGPFVLRLSGSIPRREDKLSLPVLALEGVTRETGVLAVAAQKHLKLTSAGQPSGLIPVAVSELGKLGFPYGTQENEELVFGFKYGKPGAQAGLEVAKREPKVTAGVEIVANADLDRINVDGDIRYKVEFAGVDRLRLRVPAELNTEQAFKLTADGASIKEKKAGEPKDGKVVWDVELQSKREGEFKLHFHYEIKLADLGAGAQRDVTLHEVEALDSARETGDLALLKHENLVITDKQTDGLERRNPTKELPPSLAKLNGFSGYHYVSHPWALTLNIVRYDFQAPLGKIVEHLHVDEVISKDGTEKCEAWIRLRNNQSQFLRVLVPVGAEVLSPVLVGGKETEPSRIAVAGSAQTGVDIMLPEETRKGDAPVLIRMHYRMKEPRSFGTLGSLDLEAPTFPTDDKSSAGVPVGRFTRRLWLPDKVCYTDFDTDMTTHFEQGGIFEAAKNLFFSHLRETEGAAGAIEAERQTRAMATGVTGAYPQLERPTSGISGGEARLFEKLDGQARLHVTYASWPALYGLAVLALAAVVALGVFVESRKIASPIAYFAVASGAIFFAGVVASRSYEPFLATALTGSVGLGAFWFFRACWREVTVESHRRRLEALQREAEVAKARAAAAEAEARVSATPKAPPAEPKGGSPAEGRGGEQIGFDESLKRDLPPQA